MITDVREMTVADYDREFSDEGIGEIIKIMLAFKSIMRNNSTYNFDGVGFREFNKVLNDCIIRLESVQNKYI